MEVKLHDIGEGMTEADINCYLVKPGDVVKADEPLIEVQTDKMTAEIPSPIAGIVREILKKPGETAKVGETLLILGASEETVDKKEITGSTPPRILASPYTRKIARENTISIEEVTGTGPAGRITEGDVLQLVEKRKNEVSRISKPASEKVTNSSEPITETLSEGSEPVFERSHRENAAQQLQKDENVKLPFRGRRKAIAKKMVQSLYTIPHCTHFEEIDMTELMLLREQLREHNRQVSATAFFMKALSVALREYPVFNARLDEEREEIVLLKEHHLGVAVDAPDGLVVPVLHNVERKSVGEIHQECKAVTKQALDGTLSLKATAGGTFTISNVGPLGGSIGATPIIQHPQTALISFHKTKKRPVVIKNDEIAVRSMMNISMSFDHRVADGATAVAFTNRFRELIENPNLLVLELR
ncbi:dihydrolipoamide acetyltransferase family protein [Bacillus massilinigeriensis]|uniref:dihydrolipoamide acetyltransferase family protein n=1 Tax=Bacillus mediterraneensis TaxID=1805474 RepID=UPI0008F90E83|nr:dihydrolipoamide acetyltransferase family protein [Bacillus mediterraneensis]